VVSLVTTPVGKIEHVEMVVFDIKFVPIHFANSLYVLNLALKLVDVLLKVLTLFGNILHLLT